MRFTKFIFIVLITLGLAACTWDNNLNEIQSLNNSSAVGSPFTKKLADEYRTFANYQLNQDFDNVDALHFARKGLAAAGGQIVMPEPVNDWDLAHDQVQTLSAARARLMSVFNLGAYDRFPEISAIAQSRFDCWVEAEEEARFSINAYSIPCKAQFFDALAQLESKASELAPPPAPAPLAPAPAFPEPVQALNGYSDQPVALEDAVYLVFFDFDKSNVSSGAQNVVDTVVYEIQSRQLNAVNVVGHADTSGPRDYNQALGMRRAKAVKAALSAAGVPSNMIMTSSRGESEPLVPTADGIKEAANRRATITFE